MDKKKIFMIFFLAPPLTGALEGAQTKYEFAPNEIIVQLKSKELKTDSQNNTISKDTGLPEFNRKNRKYKVHGRKMFRRHHGGRGQNRWDEKFKRTYVLKVTPKDLDKALAEYKTDPDVEFAEPNYIYHAIGTPNDPDFSRQYAPQKINGPAAWDITTGDPSVIIAIVDSGIDFNHPDLAANIWTNAGEIPGNSIDDDGNGYIDDIRGWNFYSGTNNVMDDNSHGTHCAGIAGAQGNNNVGIAGVSWRSRLMPVKGLSSSGSGNSDSLAAAIVYAADNGAKVISNSWGGVSPSAVVENAINYAVSKGAVVVVAAGNEASENPLYPAFFANAIAVASTDENDKISSFSSYGSWVDISAPGSSVYSTVRNGLYGTKSGTSMACPTVAGVAGLLFSQTPGATSAQVRQWIMDGAKKIDSLNPGYEGKLGAGRVDAYSSLPLSPVQISGTVRTGSGTPMGNITMTLVGLNILTKPTTPAGAFEFTSIRPQLCSVRPFKQGWEFTPAERSYNPLKTNQVNQDFIGVLGSSPTVKILAPKTGSTLSNAVLVSGTASDSFGLAKVEIRIGDGDWNTVEGLTSWTYNVNTLFFENGPRAISVRATDFGGLSHVDAIHVTFTNSNRSEYHAVRKAPGCDRPTGACDSVELVDGNGTMGERIEPNFPNTIDGHPDTSNGFDYHGRGSSVDRLVIRSVDGHPLVPGKMAEIEATGWCAGPPLSPGDIIGSLDFFSAKNADQPTWVYLGGPPIFSPGIVSSKLRFMIPEGDVQAIRAMAQCSINPSHDIDDLVFVTTAVNTTPPMVTILAPSTGQTVSGVVRLQGTATDNDGLDRVEVVVGGPHPYIYSYPTTGAATWSYDFNTVGWNNGPFTITVRAIDKRKNYTDKTIALNIQNPTDSRIAKYNSKSLIPICTDLGSGCLSGNLLLGRAASERNSSNNYLNSCSDGLWDVTNPPQIAGIEVLAVDGKAMASGKEVAIKVKASGSGNEDDVDLYYKPGIHTYNEWRFLKTIKAKDADGKNTSANLVLEQGYMQGIRAIAHRPGGSLASCRWTDKFADHDDLAFQVSSTSTIKIMSPLNGQTVGRITRINGTNDNVSDITKIEVKVDNGPYQLADRFSFTGEHWSINSTADLSEGVHTITAKATNSQGFTVFDTVTFNVLHSVAEFSTTFKAPLCDSIKDICDSNTLLKGRAQIVNGPELNAPNTLGSTCPDGSSGTYHVDESIDRIVITTTSGSSLLTAGKTVRVDVTVWAMDDYTNNRLDFYLADNPNAPSWKFINTLTPQKKGSQVLSQNITLSGTSLQAVRAVFHKAGGDTVACRAVNSVWVDHDDVVFRVKVPTPGAATYDSTYKVPRCKEVGTVCDTDGATASRGNMGGSAELNRPNTLFGSCSESSSGSYRLDESIENIKVSVVDGSKFMEGKTVKVDATFYPTSSYSSDALDIYYTADALGYVWKLAGTLTPPQTGRQTLSATYNLPAGTQQLVRAQLRRGGNSTSACSTSSGFNERDDILFASDLDLYPPTIKITQPANGIAVSHTATIQGTAADNGRLEKVEISVDGGPYKPVSGLGNWMAWIDTTQLFNGYHTIIAKATDGSGKVALASIVVNVKNQTGSGFVYISQAQAPEAVGVVSSMSTTKAGEVYAFPNPSANPTFHIEYSGKPDDVQLIIFDSAGNSVHDVRIPDGARKNNGSQQIYEYAWDTSNVSSGVYYYNVRLTEDGQLTQIKKSLVVLK